MATDQQLIDSLVRALEHLQGRKATQDEVEQLLNNFRGAEGTHKQRALRAITKSAGITETQLGIRKAASDNTDRIVRDVENVADQWKPGTK